MHASTLVPWRATGARVMFRLTGGMLCVAFHLIGVWPVHVARCVSMRASAIAGMTAVKGHGKRSRRLAEDS